MKKRITSLILTAAICVSALVSCGEHKHVFGEWTVKKEASCTASGEKIRQCECGYTETASISQTGTHTDETSDLYCDECNFDMLEYYTMDFTDSDQYSIVNAEAMISALQNIVIEDNADFPSDAEVRKRKIHDIVLRSLHNAENADDTEFIEGAADYADAIYYCYYAKYIDEEGTEHIFAIPKTVGKTDYTLFPKNNSYLQVGLYDNANDELTSAIESAFYGVDIKDYAYSLKTKNEDGSTLRAAEGDTVVITFTYKSAEGIEKTISNLCVQIPKDAPVEPEDSAESSSLRSLSDLEFFEEFLCDLAGKMVGKKLIGSESKFEYTATQDASRVVTYTSVTVAGVVEGACKEVNVIHAENTKLTDLFGYKIDVTGKEITYCVYPTHITKTDFVNFNEISNIDDYITNANTILTVFYGSSSIQKIVDESGKIINEVVALEIFLSEEYKFKNADGSFATFKDIIEEFVKLQKNYEEADTVYDKASDNFEKAESALREAKRDWSDMKKTIENFIVDLEHVALELDELKSADEPDYERINDLLTYKSMLETAIEQAERDFYGDPNAQSETLNKGFTGIYEEALADYDQALLYLEQSEQLLDDAKYERDLIINNKLFKVEKYDVFGDVITDDHIAKVIWDEFSGNVYKPLDDIYYEEIIDKLTEKITNTISTYIAVDREKIPQAYVDEIYPSIYRSYESQYAAGKKTNTATPLDELYKGSFEEFLMKITGTSSLNDAQASLKEEAKDFIIESLELYTAAKVFGVVYEQAEFEVAYKEASAKLRELIAMYSKANSDNSSNGVKLCSITISGSPNDYELLLPSIEQSIELGAVVFDLKDRQEYKNAIQSEMLWNFLLEEVRDINGEILKDENGYYMFKNIAYTLKAS